MAIRAPRIVLVIVLSGILWEINAKAQEPTPLEDQWEYRLGQGLRVGNTRLTVGGYGSLKYEDLKDRPRELAASALSMFLSWTSGVRVRIFSELELEDFAVVRQGKSFGSRSDPFEVERLYADVYVVDALSIRLGKFLTPIGRWNLIHADPLVWTTSRPLVTFQPFSQNTTGGMVYGVVPLQGRDLEYSAYLEATDELDPDHHEDPFEEAIGLHTVYHLTEATQLGLSYANFEQANGNRKDRKNLFGMDMFWARQRFEVTGEFLYRWGDKREEQSEWGVFLQGTAPLPAHFFAIGRYEFFSFSCPASGIHLWTAALAFRPISPLTFKIEYSVGHHNVGKAPEGFSTSVSLLF